MHAPSTAFVPLASTHMHAVYLLYPYMDLRSSSGHIRDACSHSTHGACIPLLYTCTAVSADTLVK